MAIAYDAQSGGQILGSASSTQPISHTCTGDDRMLIVGTGTYDGTGGSKVTGVTYGTGDNSVMTKVDEQMAVTNQNHSMWYLVAPATGANNVVVTFDSGQTYIWTSIASYTGVAQEAPEASAKQNAGGGSDTYTGVVTTLTDGAWVVSSFHDGNSTPSTAGTSTTRRYSSNRTALYDTNTAVNPAAETTLNFGVPSDTQRGSITISIAPVEAVATGNTSDFFQLL